MVEICPDEDSITIGVPVYNGEADIEKCIGSILNQKEVTISEILVFNDGSEDKTEALLRGLKINNPVITILSEKKNVGRGYARQKILEHAAGKYLSWLDCDDTWDEYNLKLKISAYKATMDKVNNKPFIIYGDYVANLLDKNTSSVKVVNNYYGKKELIEYFRNSNSSNFPLLQTMFSERATFTLSSFNENLRWSEDADFLIKFFEADGFLVRAESRNPTVYYNRTLKNKAHDMETGFAKFFEVNNTYLSSNNINVEALKKSRFKSTLARAKLINRGYFFLFIFEIKNKLAKLFARNN